MKHRWFLRLLGFALVVMVLVMGGGGLRLGAMPVKAQTGGAIYLPLVIREASPTYLPPAHFCECVEYVVEYLFDGPLPGVWDFAYQMASEEYFARKEAGFRFRTPFPEPGEAIVFQPNSQFQIKLTEGPQAGEWVDATLQNSAGHVGIVQSVTPLYLTWEIELRSANWEGIYGWTHSVTVEEGCNNVGTSTIRVSMAETGISFWVPGPFSIKNLDSFKVIDIPWSATTDIDLDQFDYTGGLNQVWWIWNDLAYGDYLNEYLISSPLSSKCMDVRSGSIVPGAHIMQYTCQYSDNQIWTLTPVDPYPFYYNIVSKNSGLCLDVEGGSQENGAFIIQNTCSDSKSQKWFLILRDSYSYQQVSLSGRR